VAVPYEIFDASAISAMIAFVILIFPLNTPWIQWLRIRAQNTLDTPKNIMAAVRPRVPNNSGGFQLNLSEKLPHCTTIKASAAKNIDSCAN